MSRRVRRPAAGPKRTFVFDCEALSKAVRGDHQMRALVKAAPDLDIGIVTSALTTVEAWDPRAGARHGALWDWALSRVVVVHTDDRLVTTARSLLKATGLHGHKYTIDAFLAAVALAAAERGEQVTVFTSDVDDLTKLLADSNVRVEPA